MVLAGAIKFRKYSGRREFEPDLITPTKISQQLHNLKDHLHLLETPEVYKVPCGDSCKVYIGMIKRSINIRRMEHVRGLLQLDKSAPLPSTTFRS